MTNPAAGTPAPGPATRTRQAGPDPALAEAARVRARIGPSGRAAAAFLAIFAFGLPFPPIVLAAGLIGLAGARAGLPAFRTGGGHGRAGRVQLEAAAPLPGTELPEPGRIDRAGTLRIPARVPRAPPRRSRHPVLGPRARRRPCRHRRLPRPHGRGRLRRCPCGAGPDRAGGGAAPGPASRGEMLHRPGLAETTPGPLIRVARFPGFMAAFRDPGTLPALVAGTPRGPRTTRVTVLPCVL